LLQPREAQDGGYHGEECKDNEGQIEADEFDLALEWLQSACEVLDAQIESEHLELLGLRQ
jgi:hypothetical protein